MCIATLVFKRVDGNITSYKDVANLRAFSRLIDWLKFSTAIACWYVMMFLLYSLLVKINHTVIIPQPIACVKYLLLTLLPIRNTSRLNIHGEIRSKIFKIK